MDLAALDAAFPWFVLTYGFLVTVALGSERLVALGERYVPEEAWARFVSHRRLALFCLAIGALWTLQDVWLS